MGSQWSREASSGGGVPRNPSGSGGGDFCIILKHIKTLAHRSVVTFL